MNKKTVIKEVIEDLIQLRQKQYDELIETLIEKSYSDDLAHTNSVWKARFLNLRNIVFVMWFFWQLTHILCVSYFCFFRLFCIQCV